MSAPHARPGSLRLPVTGAPVARRGLLCGIVLALLGLVLGIWALGLGDYPLTPGETWRALTSDQGFATTIVREWRAPRVLAALALGAALAVAGAVFQSLTRNPLGSPDIIGFSTGAYTGVLLATTVVSGAYASTATGALLGGLTTAAVVYLLAYRNGVQGFRLIVVGIAVTAMLHALNLYLLLRVQAEVAMAASIWDAGSLSLVGWSQLLPALVLLAVLTPVVALLVPGLRQLELGDDAAIAHGIRAERTRLALMAVAVALVSVATAAAGPIAFVALAAPQLAHRVIGGSGIPVLGSALVGGVLLLGADMIAAHLVGHDVPVGVVTVVLGGTYLLGLLIAQARRR